MLWPCTRITQVLLFSLTISASMVQAKEADHVAIGRIQNQNFGNWAIGDGAQSVTIISCASSSNYDNPYDDPPPAVTPPAVHLPYQFKVTQLATPAGHYLYLDGDDTNTGNARIAVQFEHRDVKTPSTFETLSDNIYDTHLHDGQFRLCKSGDNSELRMTLTQAELEKARAGTYRTDFRAGVIGGSSGTASATTDFFMRISVSTAAQVSGLSNIDLGVWDGTGDLVAEEGFCVYSNTTDAAYELSISSPGQDGGGNFYLSNPGATVSIPYQLRFKDDVSPGGGVLVGTASLTGNGNNSVVDCGGIDNAKLSVTLLAADLGAAANNIYSDTITLVVVPL
ncbi:MAG: hypothetical protein WD002_11860 [Pseudomonadales bacterium]